MCDSGTWNLSTTPACLGCEHKHCVLCFSFYDGQGHYKIQEDPESEKLEIAPTDSSLGLKREVTAAALPQLSKSQTPPRELDEDQHFDKNTSHNQGVSLVVKPQTSESDHGALPSESKDNQKSQVILQAKDRIMRKHVDTYAS